MIPSAEQRRLRRDIGWNLIPVVLLAGVGLGMNFAIGGWWGSAALGAFNLVTISVFSFAVLGAGGLQYAVLRAVAEAPDDRDHVAAMAVGALVPVVGLAALATAGFLALRGTFGALQGPAVAEGMAWAAPGLFCFAVNKVLLGVVNGLRRMRAFAMYTSLRYASLAVGLVLARGLGLSGDQLPVVWSIAEGAVLVALLGELVATVSLRRCAGWRAAARRHLGFGARGVGATLAQEVNSKLDVWLLGVAVPNALVGVYSLAAALYEGATQLAVVVQNNVNPVLARDLASDDRAAVRTLVARTRRWFVPTMIVACGAGAAIYPAAIPWLLGDPAFAAGALPFAILMAGIALASPYLPFVSVLLMAARPGWHTVLVVATVAVNAAGCLLLIPALGLTGAALAAATSLVANALLLRWLARDKNGRRILAPDRGEARRPG